MNDRQKIMSDLEGLTFDDWHMYHSDTEVQGIAIDALELLKEQQETIVSLQSTINKLTKALAERPEQKFFVDSDGKMTPLPIQKHGHWISAIKGSGHYTCSCCGTGRYMNFVPNYCSECGARMDEEVERDG